MARVEARSKGANQYPKMEKPGDGLKGRLRSWDTGVAGKFKKENRLVLEGEGDDTLTYNAGADVSGKLENNLDLLVPGVMIEIVYTHDKDTGKGNPMKCFTVSIGEDDSDRDPGHEGSAAHDDGFGGL